MRVILLAPCLAIFGCAHQGGGGSAENTQPPPVIEGTQPPAVEGTQPPAVEGQPPVSQTSPAPSPPSASAQQPSAPPAGLACAPIKVHFALDSAELYDSEKPLLDATARCLGDNEKQRVTIVGNADERGSVAYNQALGQRRADAVAHYLESKGAAASQVEAVISHGEESPICQESSLKCWQLNRRTAVRESCHL